MPWWAVTYAVLYFLLSVCGDALSFKSRNSTQAWLADAVAHFGVGVLLVGFWYSSLVAALGWFALAFFVAAVVWEVFSATSDAKEVLARDATSSTQKLAEILGPYVIVGPAYVFAGLAAFEAIE